MIMSQNVLAQKRKAERAYAAFSAGEYYEAIDLFKDAYTKTKEKEVKADLLFMVAECYRITNDSKNAETWYKKAVKAPFIKPEAQLMYAETLKKNGKYDLAIPEFRSYKQIAPTDARADIGIRSCELANEWMAKPENYVVEDIKDLNSRESDFSPVFARDDFSMLLFTSSREDASGNKKHGATGQSFTDIFETRLDKKGKWSIPVPAEGINTEFEEGTPSLTGDFKELYFTRCEAGKREKKGCVIMYSSFTNNAWSAPQKIDLFPDSLVAAHPAISPDGMTIYFVSDVRGGYGGKDIWYSTRQSADGTWSKPLNAGPDINTRGDELFPYVRANGTLYFSSDGHPGMGGLDIFKAIPQPGGSWIVQNMKYPINSNADDFSISFEGINEKGLFASTRKGKGNDELYSFELPPLRFNITGIVKDEKTNAPIINSVIQLIASDGDNLQTESGQAGDFRFMLKPNTDYIFLASKKGYLNGKEKESTRGLDRSRDFMTTISLTSIEKPIELPNIFYDFGKWDLRPESMVSLDKLVETLNDNPNVTIELMSHTDSRDTDEYNNQLSQKRAQSVVNYLISKGIDPARLLAKGYGESEPKVVDAETNSAYGFLNQGVRLTEQYINSLTTEEMREIAHQVNRRTEFRVLRTDFSQGK